MGIDDGNRRHQTPVFIAAKEGYLNVVRYLTERNADILKQDIFGRSPLDVATLHRRKNVEKFLEAEIKKKNRENKSRKRKNKKKKKKKKTGKKKKKKKKKKK